MGTRESFTKPQLKKQREAWKIRLNLNGENNCEEDDGDDEYEEEDDDIDESGNDNDKDDEDDGGDDGDNRVEEASPNGNKNEKKNASITTSDEDQMKQIYENILEQKNATETVALLVTKTECIETGKFISCFSIDPVKGEDLSGTKKRKRDYAKTIKDPQKKLADAVRYASWGEWKGEQEIRMNVDDLIEELIRNIRRLPRYCVECEEWYRSEPNTEKVAECLICQVGIHGCENVERRLKEGLRNSTWICKECNDTLHGEDERILKGVRKNVKTTTAKVSKTRPIREGRRSSSLDEANRGDERERTSGTGTSHPCHV